MDSPCLSSNMIVRLNDRFFQDDSKPTTPVVNEANKDAAMKMFESYNYRRSQTTPSIATIDVHEEQPMPIKVRDITACGIQGGVLTLNVDDRAHFERGGHGMLRSNTIGPEIRDYEDRKARYRSEERRASSYAGSPTFFLQSHDEEHETSETLNTDTNYNTLLESAHCYPEIHIINENNVEQDIHSGNESSDTHVPEAVERPNAKIQQELNDSGYPSTNVSNTTTQSSALTDNPAVSLPSASASVRRKMFSAKSASFYNIGTADEDNMDTMPRVDTVHVYNSNEDMQKHVMRRSTDVSNSFESGNCGTCKVDLLRKQAYSFDSDIDRFSYLQDKQVYSDCRCTGHKHRRAKHKRRHRSTKFDRHESRDQGCSLKHSSSNYRRHAVSTGELRIPRERFRRGFSTCSSSESDSVLCGCSHHRKHRHQRRSYLSRNALSENDYADRGSSRGHHHLARPCFSDSRDTLRSYRQGVMSTFRADSYQTKCQAFCDAISDPANTKDILQASYSRSMFYPVKMNNTVMPYVESPTETFTYSTRPAQQFGKSGRMESAYGVGYTSSSTAHGKGGKRFEFSDEPVSILSTSTPENEVVQGKTINTGQSNLNERLKDSTSGRTRSTLFEQHRTYEGNQSADTLTSDTTVDTRQKDSAYQTKQSSVDKFREDRSFSNSSSVKGRSYSSKAK